MRAAGKVLTDRALDALRPGQELRDARTPGFGARCRESGRVFFFLRYAAGDSRTRIPLGERTAQFGLAEARRAAEDRRRELDAGRDPAAEAQAAREARALAAAARKAAREREAIERRAARERALAGDAEPGTLADLVNRYLAVRANKLAPRWRREVESKAGRIVALLGGLPVAEIRRRDLVVALDRLEAEHGEKVCETYRKLIRAIFGWAHEREEIEANPCPTKARAKRTERERHLDEAEIRALWAATEELDPVTGSVWRVVLLTAQRPGSVKAMRREDLSADSWLIPARYMKSGEAHRVHLSPQALREIERLDKVTGRSPWVFRSPRPRLRGGKPPKRWRPGSTIGPLEHLQASTRALNRRVAEILGRKIEPFRPHDLRRSAATLLAEAGITNDVIDRIQNHKLTGIRRVYNRAELAALTREALDALGEEIDRILADRPRKSKASTPKVRDLAARKSRRAR